MTQELPAMSGPVCPIPLPHTEHILLGHGSGGKMTQDLIQKVFMPLFENPSLRKGDDAGVVEALISDLNGNSIEGQLAISTDSHVVWPLFFPGGDIGKLAVCGTVNDVAMMGAQTSFLTVGFILEEGLDLNILVRVADSMRKAADEAGVMIVAGDTKVVQKGKADGLYINTTGVGMVPPGVKISGENAIPGDIVILSGTVGDHGIAVLEARQELGFESDIQSDIAPLNHVVSAILKVSHQIHVLRDPTRGGVATSLNEIARQSQVNILIDEDAIPVRPQVAMACEMLGFDPLFIANEGKMIAIVSPQDASKVLYAMRETKYGKDAVIIGEVSEKPQGLVLMKTAIGSTRVVDMPSGEILPRIC